MAINTPPVPDARLNMKIRSLFLDHLAQTANVAASARAAGVTSSAVYAERRRTPAFRDAWALALAEGYARLETDLGAADAKRTHRRWHVKGAGAKTSVGDCLAQHASCRGQGWRACCACVQDRPSRFGDVKGAIGPEADAHAATRPRQCRGAACTRNRTRN